MIERTGKAVMHKLVSTVGQVANQAADRQRCDGPSEATVTSGMRINCASTPHARTRWLHNIGIGGEGGEGGEASGTVNTGVVNKWQCCMFQVEFTEQGDSVEFRPKVGG